MKVNAKDFLVSFLKHKATVEFYNAVSSIPRSHEFPFFNYIGVNFRNNELYRVKLYCTTFQKFPYQQIEDLLPTLNDFKEYYPHFEESKIQNLQHTGCAFTLKADADFNFTKGFHLRLDAKKFSGLRLPKYLQLRESDKENYQGISFEYTGCQAGKKKEYYYITDTVTKEQLADDWGNDTIAQAKVIEYTETEGTRKIIVWDDFWEKENKVAIQFSDKHESFNQMMKSEFGLQNRFAGIYLGSDEQASYYSYLKDNSRESFSSFDTYTFIKQRSEV